MAAVVVNGVEWAVASRSRDAGKPSGDLHVVAPVREGVFIAVIDGVGHGEKAAQAARAAAKCLCAGAARLHMLTLAAECHESLKGTRGAVVSMAMINVVSKVMPWLGIGNVECVRFPASGAARDRLLLRAGTLGHSLPPLRAEVLPLALGDSVVFATDGIRSDFDLAFVAADSTQGNADRMLTHARKGKDDALVLAARYTGRS